jgi:hypothetical protein
MRGYDSKKPPDHARKITGTGTADANIVTASTTAILAANLKGKFPIWA